MGNPHELFSISNRRVAHVSFLILSCDNGEKEELENAILDGYFDVWMVCCLYSEIYVSVFVPLKNVGCG